MAFQNKQRPPRDDVRPRPEDYADEDKQADSTAGQPASTTPKTAPKR
jgi:hypothetical protein